MAGLTLRQQERPPRIRKVPRLTSAAALLSALRAEGGDRGHGDAFGMPEAVAACGEHDQPDERACSAGIDPLFQALQGAHGSMDGITP